ncbi:MAG: mandelate racemase/muconate lactonizing enzyme family protein [Bryobacterales bacterium]|nr:mandelate racemase/muconate lactonizing enzyme family protein [Bryobacterales bacterium]
MRPTDISLGEIGFQYEDYGYRTPIKFGGIALDRVTLLNVRIRVRSRAGAEAEGFGSMPLGNVWSFPSRVLPYDQTLHAMKRVAEEVARITAGYRGTAHPIDINWELEPQYLEAAGRVTRELGLAEAIPKLSTLVVASAFDAAIHDGFGKAAGINCYRGYSAQYMDHDLGHFLGGDFRGEFLDRYVSPAPKPSMPLYHLVGALDPIFDSDLGRRIGDGLPETLAEWVLADGLTHIKVKLNGEDLAWDVSRVAAVERAVAGAQEQRGIAGWHYSLDFNERCPDVGYLLEFLRRVREHSPALFDRIQYIEQPTARDLKSGPRNDVHAAARIKPVVIDESLVDYESLLAARELGYTGVALKACKGQSNALLMAAAARKFGMFLCVQDLTCPGASLIHSAGLAAHIPEVAAIEANARQYVPAANQAWKARFPGVFIVKEGVIGTGVLDGPGLGAVPPGGSPPPVPALGI